MIANDVNAIRDAMRKIAQAKVQGEAEAARKATTDDSRTIQPQQRVLFDEPGAPFRGFFVEDEWDHVTLNSGFAELG